MDLSFLGTGGGRFTTISQKLMTGGFRIDGLGGLNYHFDPGPGALIRSYQFGINPSILDGIFISHAHTDHYTDAEILIEAMTSGMTKNRGIIIGSKSVIDGYKKWGPCVSKYHKSQSTNLILGSNKTKELKGFKIKGTKTIHGDPTGVGFQIDDGNLKISYTSDTKYFEDLKNHHKKADILIANVLRPFGKPIHGHMDANEFLNLVNDIQPKIAIMAHFGFNFIKANPQKIAETIKKETGVDVIASFDGMNINLDKIAIDSSYNIIQLENNCKNK
ncbi:MAG: MBL fold metallo-hydrolase [Methanobrevibacter sp.]|jgi:phosphoribosyl 1,2-cyclic phosphodiesterase|nr:MBL fold metallo-hydrolase [Candidatus Methanoflexus mossambicus]